MERSTYKALSGGSEHGPTFEVGHEIGSRQIYLDRLFGLVLSGVESLSGRGQPV